MSPARSPCSSPVHGPSSFVPSALLQVDSAGCPRHPSPCGRRSASSTWGAAAAFRMGACNQPGQSHFLRFAMNIYAICAELLELSC